MAYQMLRLNVREILQEQLNSTRASNSISEKPAELSDDEKSSWLAQTVKTQRQLECIRSYGLTPQEIKDLNQQEKKLLTALTENEILCPFEWTRDKIFKRPGIQNGIELIKHGAQVGLPELYETPDEKEAESFPTDVLKAFPSLLTAKNVFAKRLPSKSLSLINDCSQPDPLTWVRFFQKLPQAQQQSFSGFFLVLGDEFRKWGHAHLVEINHQKKLYISYDNNLGFSSFSSPEDLFKSLNGNLAKNYKRVNFYPFVFNGKTAQKTEAL